MSSLPLSSLQHHVRHPGNAALEEKRALAPKPPLTAFWKLSFPFVRGVPAQGEDTQPPRIHQSLETHLFLRELQNFRVPAAEHHQVKPTGDMMWCHWFPFQQGTKGWGSVSTQNTKDEHLLWAAKPWAAHSGDTSVWDPCTNLNSTQYLPEQSQLHQISHISLCVSLTVCVWPYITLYDHYIKISS